jgi:preprotein translocase subunit SecE
MITFGGVMLLAAIGAVRLSDKIHGYGANAYIRYGVPVGLLALVAWLMFRLVNRPRSADFLIATEGEMKKVSWSSRKEIVGSTKVVIVFSFLMAAILFGVDLIFKQLFDLLLGR